MSLTDVIPADITGVQYKVSGRSEGFAPWPAGNGLSLSTLEALEMKTVWVRGQDSLSPAEGILVNTADVSLDTPDPVAGNNGATGTIRVLDPGPWCELSVVTSVDHETTVRGGCFLENLLSR